MEFRSRSKSQVLDDLATKLEAQPRRSFPCVPRRAESGKRITKEEAEAMLAERGCRCRCICRVGRH
jgi:hypothetical protein